MRTIVGILLLLIVRYGYSQSDIYEYHNCSSCGSDQFNAPFRAGQTFTIGTVSDNEIFVLDSIEVLSSPRADDTYPLYYEIYNTSGGYPTGIAISTGTCPGDGTDCQNRKIEMTKVELQPSTQYAFVVYSNATYTGLFAWYGSVTTAYSGGKAIVYSGSWGDHGMPADFNFRVHGRYIGLLFIDNKYGGGGRVRLSDNKYDSGNEIYGYDNKYGTTD
jgi:hypothetical protein